MAKLSKKQRQVAQDVALVGAAVAGATKLYETGKKVYKGVKANIKKRKEKKKLEEQKKNEKLARVKKEEQLSLDTGVTTKEAGKVLRAYKNNKYKEGQ